MDLSDKIKNWIATLTGGEQAPDNAAEGEKYRQETQRQEELAKTQEEAQKERMVQDVPLDVPGDDEVTEGPQSP
ncbi:MAG: hypothetical protein Q8P35_02215 [Candidatus Yanofskybacteria bacterium]|nr:hypothetical protein [Candidatus Yanofskybacteria bacterium]